jgi:hypothetical protein
MVLLLNSTWRGYFLTEGVTDTGKKSNGDTGTMPWNLIGIGSMELATGKSRFGLAA